MISSLVHIDHSIFYWLYDVSGKSQVLDAVIIFCAEYLTLLVILFVFWHAYRLWRKHNEKAFIPYLEALIAIAISNGVVVPIFRILYERVRPYVALHLTHNLLVDPTFSFPFGHAIFMFTLATSIFFYDKRFGTFLYVCGIFWTFDESVYCESFLKSFEFASRVRQPTGRRWSPLLAIE